MTASASEPTMSRAASQLLCLYLSLEIGIIAALMVGCSPSIPQAVQLDDAGKAGASVSVLVPSGSNHQLLLALHSADPTNRIFVLKIWRDRLEVYSRTQYIQEATPCNWLRSYGITEAKILTWPTERDRRHFDNIVKPNDRLSVDLSFIPSIGGSNSIWLTWLGRSSSKQQLMKSSPP